MPDFIIDDATLPNVYSPPGTERGLVPRDYSKYPQEMFQSPSEMILIPRSEWDARIEEQERLQSSLEHIRATMKNGAWFPSYNQNPDPFCWAYSTTHTAMFSRAAANQPFIDLQAHGVANKIKNFQKE